MIADNGRIRLTWPQIAWGLAVLVAIIGGWYDLRYQVRGMLAVLELHNTRIVALENSNARGGFSQSDAEQLKDDIIKAVKGRK
jgi:hypothetical protein